MLSPSMRILKRKGAITGRGAEISITKITLLGFAFSSACSTADCSSVDSVTAVTRTCFGVTEILERLSRSRLSSPKSRFVVQPGGTGCSLLSNISVTVPPAAIFVARSRMKERPTRSGIRPISDMRSRLRKTSSEKRGSVMSEDCRTEVLSEMRFVSITWPMISKAFIRAASFGAMPVRCTTRPSARVVAQF